MSRFFKKKQQSEAEEPEVSPPNRKFSLGEAEDKFSLALHRISMVMYMAVPFLVFFAILGVGIWVAFSVTDQEDSSDETSQSLLSLDFDGSNLPRFLEAHLEAIGGRESVEQIRSVRDEGRLVSGSVLFDYIGLLLLPDKGMLIQSPRGSKSGSRQLMLNGEAAWQLIYKQDGSRIAVPLKDATKKLLKWSLRIHDPFRSLELEGDAKGLDFRETEFMGKPCYEVTRSMPDGSILEVVLDKETLYVLETSETLDLGEGIKECTVQYDDHRIVSGVVEPHHSRF